MIDNPIFIIGTERSGSNLLRMILIAHPHISIPHPPHIMRDFSKMISRYGDLNNQRNFLRLASDIKEIVESHFSPWPFDIDLDELVKSAPSKTLYGLYVALYDLYRRDERKLRFGCKSTFMFAEIDSILAHHKHPKFIHLVRDPRDVAVSASASIFSKYHPFKMAQLWAYEQSAIFKFKYLEDENKLLTVRYEDLVTDSKNTVMKIMRFIDEEFLNDQLEYFKKAESKRLAGLSQSWKNVENPIQNSSVGQYKKKMKLEEVAMIEFVCGDLMTQFNYNKDLSSSIEIFTPLDIKRFDLLECLMQWKVEIRSMFTDKNFILRWKKKFILKRMAIRQFIKNGV